MGVSTSHLFMFDKVDDEGDWLVGEGRKLEVFFYPELDHVTVFDTKERRPLLDILVPFVIHQIHVHI
jgi:hypothetical protein